MHFRNLTYFILIFTCCVSRAFTHCLLFHAPSTPENHSEAQSLDEDSEVWCYRALNAERSEWFVYKHSGEEAPKLELSFLMSPGHLKHASSTHGLIEFVDQSPVLFNPFPVPLAYDEALEASIGEWSFDSEQVSNAQPTLWMLNSQQFRRVSINKQRFRTLDESPFPNETVTLPENKHPWDGDWWPYNGDVATDTLAFLDDSSLAKYDWFVQKTTGTNPGARAWENANHSDAVVEWGGHCNGWAAASVLHPLNPNNYLITSLNQVISARDIQGMRVETSFCVDRTSYGARYYGPNDDIDDIYPDKFHKALIYNIRELKRPIATDYMPDDHVDNSVITGYSFEYGELTDGVLPVVAKVNLHRYAFWTRETIVQAQRARFDVVTYRYNLQLDENNNIIGGQWITSQHPDFLWVPLAQSKCGRENPRMHHTYVDKLEQWLESSAQKVTHSAVNFMHSDVVTLAPQAEHTFDVVDTTLGYAYSGYFYYPVCPITFSVRFEKRTGAVVEIPIALRTEYYTPSFSLPAGTPEGKITAVTLKHTGTEECKQPGMYFSLSWYHK